MASVVTMGVDQVAGGLDVRISEWHQESVSKTPLLAGKLYGPRAWRGVEHLLYAFGVKLALIDPMPDQRAADRFVADHPETTALYTGGQHNADSLEEAARRLLSPEAETLDEALEAQVIDPIYSTETGLVTYRILVPPGVDVPTGIRIAFEDMTVLEQPNGTKMVEVVGVPAKVRATYDDAREPDFPAGHLPAPPAPSA